MPTQPLIRAEFESFKKKIIIFALIISMGCAAGIFSTYNESQHRTKQFCALTVARANDNVRQFDQVVEYLRSPVGQENTGFNDVIRKRSFPQSALIVKFDKAHRASVCTDVGLVYKDTKYPGALQKALTPPKPVRQERPT